MCIFPLPVQILHQIAQFILRKTTTSSLRGLNQQPPYLHYCPYTGIVDGLGTFLLWQSRVDLLPYRQCRDMQYDSTIRGTLDGQCL